MALLGGRRDVSLVRWGEVEVWNNHDVPLCCRVRKVICVDLEVLACAWTWRCWLPGTAAPACGRRARWELDRSDLDRIWTRVGMDASVGTSWATRAWIAGGGRQRNRGRELGIQILDRGIVVFSHQIYLVGTWFQRQTFQNGGSRRKTTQVSLFCSPHAAGRPGSTTSSPSCLLLPHTAVRSRSASRPIAPGRPWSPPPCSAPMPLYTGSPSPAAAAAAAALRSASPSSRTATYVMFRQKLSFMVAFQAQHLKYAPNLIRSVIKSIRSDITDGDNGTTEPARELLERLFVKTQSLDTSASHDSELSMSIEVLKSEFERALSILGKKERDIQDAEKRVSDDRGRLNQTKQDLDQREKEISKAYVRQQGIEKALKRASRDLALRVKQINNLKLLVEGQDKKIASSQAVLSQKVVEVENLKQDMFKKNEEANLMRSEIKSKEQLLLATNQAVVQQEATVRELRSEIKRKTMDIARSNDLRKANEEKLKVAEQELEKQNLGWLAAQQELKELAQLASKDTDDIKGTITDFKRVRSLLDAVRAELISSKAAFASSRRQIEDQAVQLQKQVQELKDQRVLLMSYTHDLEAAQLEIQRKTKELNDAHSRCHELESQLIQEMEKVESLEAKLTKERESWEQRTEQVEFLQKELAYKENECSKSQELVQVKESELLEARHEVQDMRLKVESIQLAVQEKDSELSDTQSRLTEVGREIIDLQQLLNSKEDQLVQLRTQLHDKEQHIETMESELDSIRFRCSQAESVVKRMAELTGNLASSVKVGEMDIYALLDDEISSTGTALKSNLHKHNLLEADIGMLRESLRHKDMDLRAAHEALDAKDQELKAVLRKWDVKEMELSELDELPEDPSAKKQPAGLSSDIQGGRVVGEMELQKLQIEAAEVEALAATAALKKLADMTKKSFKRGKADSGINLVASDSANIGEYDSEVEVDKKMDVILEAEKEIVRLFSLTKQLVTDDAINDVQEQ